MIFKLGQRYFNETVGLWSALTFAINPFQVWYGQEIKLYALLPLAAAGSMVAFVAIDADARATGAGLVDCI